MSAAIRLLFTLRCNEGMRQEQETPAYRIEKHRSRVRCVLAKNLLLRDFMERENFVVPSRLCGLNPAATVIHSLATHAGIELNIGTISPGIRRRETATSGTWQIRIGEKAS